MEHRWSTRKPCPCTVVIDSPYVGTVAATARNIGLGGMFVEVGGLALPLNTPVRVGFSLDHHEYGERFRLPAMVVRRAPEGLAIMFLDTTPALVGSLRRALEETGRGAGPAAVRIYTEERRRNFLDRARRLELVA